MVPILDSDERTMALFRAASRSAADSIAALPDACGPEVVRAARAIVQSLAAGRHFWAFGNGGSAADAQHIAAELAGRFLAERRSLSATALTANSSSLTAIGNDYGFEHIFARQLEGVCSSGDSVLGISTSGDSANVVRALELARKAGATAIGLTGRRGGAVARVAEIAIRVPADETQRIQECHIVVGHTLCHLVEEALFPPTGGRS